MTPDPIDLAYEYALREIARSSRSLTPSERHMNLRRLLSEHPEYPDAKIAELLGVSRMTVWRARNTVTPSEVANMPTSPAASEVAKRLLRAIERLYGTGAAELLSPGRTARHLAKALTQACGEKAIQRARRFEAMLAAARRILETKQEEETEE